MDPPHITEFASQRYFQKIDQFPKDQQDDGRTIEDSSAQSQFILPIRQADQRTQDLLLKPGDSKRAEKEKGKRGFFARLRSSKSTVPVTVPEPQFLRRTSVASVASVGSIGDTTSAKHRSPPSPTFDQLFLALPNELQVQIIASLPLSDVLNLRLASRSWHEMITLNESPITRYHLAHHIPTYATRLYPVPEAAGGLNLHYLCGLWHRLHVAAKLSVLMSDWVTREIFLRTSKEEKAGFAAQTERMRRRMIPLLFTVFHFFETYRTLHLKYVKEHGYGLERTPYTLNPIEVQIMNLYDDRTLLQVHQVFPLIISSFCRRLRPPSYVGRVEATMRGYMRQRPPDEVHTAILCLGGMRLVLRLWEVKGYNVRRGAVDTWYNSVNHIKISDVPTESTKESKPRGGILGLGRKREDSSRRPSSPGSSEQIPTTNSMMTTNLVFRTSLSAGMPMDRLEEEESYNLLIPDLPVLQKIWVNTAETLVLRRRIVARSGDIKRNAQVMLDLIKEAPPEEDEWWYGNRAPDTIQPSLEVIREALEE